MESTVSSGSKLRYPLRSSTRSKAAAAAAAAADPSESSASGRARPSPSVSQSVSVLDLSAKDKSAKPPRRLSIPTKSTTISPRQASVGSITPISETRLNRSNTKGKSDTPVSDASKSATRRKFCALSSVSYWLTQIKLSESASKHSVSLGFFKLALESGCEPLQRIREELKSYVLRHNLSTELEEATKNLLQSYNIPEEFEQLKLSEMNSTIQEDGMSTSNKDVRRSSVSTGSGNLKPKSLVSNALTVADSNKDIVEKRVTVSKDKASNFKNNIRKKSQKSGSVEARCGNTKAKGSKKEAINKEGDSADSVPVEEVSHEDKENITENKENMDSISMEGEVLKEEIQTS